MSSWAVKKLVPCFWPNNPIRFQLPRGLVSFAIWFFLFFDFTTPSARATNIKPLCRFYLFDECFVNGTRRRSTLRHQHFVGWIRHQGAASLVWLPRNGQWWDANPTVRCYQHHLVESRGSDFSLHINPCKSIYCKSIVKSYHVESC